MKNKYKYSISIVCFNNIEYTKKCIDSILKYSKDYELLLWNNGSTDGTKEYFIDLIKKYDFIRIVNSDFNEGFSLPQNRQAKNSIGKYFICLNNDIEVCENWLEKLNEPFKDSNIAITGIENTCCSVQDNGIGYKGDLIEYIEGSCLMIPKLLIDKYGLFDTDTFHFAYCEDVDLSLRLREKGFQIKVVDLNIKHYRAATAKIVKVDLEGYKIKNHKALLQRWDYYFKNHSFTKTVLIKRKIALGDVIFITPIVKEIKEKYPMAIIDIWTDYIDVFKNNPDINKSFKEQPDVELYDYYLDLDLCYEYNPKSHILENYARKCGVALRKELFLYPDIEDEKKAIALFEGKKIAIFHTEHTPKWDGRNLPIERYIFAQSYLKEKGYLIVELGKQRNLKSDIIIEQTNFSQLCAYIKHSNIFIGQDSALFHIAQAYKIPSVIPFGMITPEYRIIDYQYVAPLQAKDLSCLGCHHRNNDVILGTKCERDNVYCMINITDLNMKEAIDKMLNHKLFNSETAKCRERLIQYCEGYGIDCGAGGDPINDSAIIIDLPTPYSNAGIKKVNLGGDARNLFWFKNESLDYVYSSHLLEDFTNTKEVLIEWLRVLKKGGRLIIYCPNEQIFRLHCKNTGQVYNSNHQIEEFSLFYIRDILLKIGNIKILHENPLVDDYSFEIVVEKI